MGAGGGVDMGEAGEGEGPSSGGEGMRNSASLELHAKINITHRNSTAGRKDIR